MRVVHRDTARAAIGAHTARQQAERQRRARAHANNTGRATRARVRAIQQRQQDSGLQLDDMSLTDAAYATVTAGHHAARLEASGSALDEMLRAGRSGDVVGVYHSLSGKQED
jgi:hypothetical protein